VHKGYWLDIGRPEDHAIAVKQFDENKKKFLGEENEAGEFFGACSPNEERRE
jgi:NDP-sugar pyrophosphorylase family protein